MVTLLGRVSIRSAPYTEIPVMSSYQSFLGVDLHKCTVTLTAVDAAGEITRLKIST